MTFSAHPALVAHARVFRREVVAVAAGVWSALGFAASNVHVVEGRTGLVVIDSTESTSAAENVIRALREKTDKPVHTLIYTHAHRSHISGAAAFAQDGALEIIGGPGFQVDPMLLPTEKANGVDPTQARKRRAGRAYGSDLPSSQQVSLGCGPANRPTEGFGSGYLPPTRLCPQDGMTLEKDGVALELASAPGPTADHILVWNETAGALFCGDIWCNAFPNLYPIRGNPYRDLNDWVLALETAMTYGAEALCPGHTRPVTGQNTVREVLQDTRDALVHIMAATADGLNAGKSLNTLAEEIALPSYLESKPHLQQVFGRVDWAVRSYAQGQMGWFDGNPTSLAPLPTADEARRFINLAGGADAVLVEAEATDAPQWAMQLCDRLIAAGEETHQARALKAACLEVLAEGELNAQARNYYLSCARELSV